MSGSETSPSAAKRPLSPHLQVYRWTITMATSILHRVAGVALVVFGFGFVIGLASLTGGSKTFGTFLEIITSPVGIVMLVGFSGAFWFYVFKEIQHLFNAVGMGFELEAAHKGGWIVLGASILATALTWYFTFIGLPA